MSDSVRASPEPVSFVADPAAASALMQPLRRTILHHLSEPGSASSVARALEMPRQRVGYHVRALEGHGLLEHVGDKRRGNCVERLLRATATSYLLDPLVVSGAGADPKKATDRLSSQYLLATAAQLVSDVGRLRARAQEAGRQLPTLTIETDVQFASAADQAAFAEALADSVARLAAQFNKPSAADGRRFRFVIGGHPAPAPDDTLSGDPQ